jgi:hypothetical protein
MQGAPPKGVSRFRSLGLVHDHCWGHLIVPDHPGHGPIYLHSGQPCTRVFSLASLASLFRNGQTCYVPKSRGQVSSMLTTLMLFGQVCSTIDHACS